MGVWSQVFRDAQAAEEFRSIVLSDKPVGPRRAGDVFYGSVGADGFLNLVDEFAEARSSADMRPYAVAWIEKWLEAGSGTWTYPWDPGVERSLKETVAEYRAANPDVPTLPADYLEAYFGVVHAPRP